MKEMRLRPEDENNCNESNKEAKSVYFPNGVVNSSLNDERGDEGKGRTISYGI